MAKGSKSDPYTMAEYNEMLQNGTWKGGYVKDDNGNVSYTLPELVANGYSGSGSGSGCSSGNGSGSDFQFGSYKSFQGDPGLDDDDEDDEESGGNNGNNNQSSGGNGEYFGGGGGGTGGHKAYTNTLIIGSHTEISDYSQEILRSLKGNYGKIAVQSTLRSPEKQASIMLQNIKKNGVNSQLALYGRYGDAVINVYNPNARDEENLQAMTAEVYRQGPRNVSKHCMTAEEYKKLNVIDISRTQMTNPSQFIKEISSSYKDIKYFDEVNNGCIHIEIPQP